MSQQSYGVNILVPFGTTWRSKSSKTIQRSAKHRFLKHARQVPVSEALHLLPEVFSLQVVTRLVASAASNWCGLPRRPYFSDRHHPCHCQFLNPFVTLPYFYTTSPQVTFYTLCLFVYGQPIFPRWKTPQRTVESFIHCYDHITRTRARHKRVHEVCFFN